MEKPEFSPEVIDAIRNQQDKIGEHVVNLYKKGQYLPHDRTPAVFVANKIGGGVSVGWIYLPRYVNFFETIQVKMGGWGDKDFTDYQVVWQWGKPNSAYIWD